MIAPKVERQLLKVKALDARMIETLSQLQAAKDAATNAREEETRLYNLANDLDKELQREKDSLFELLRTEK